MSAKIAFIYSEEKLSGRLTKFFTNSYCYHVGWVVTNPATSKEEFFDMHLTRRVRNWPYYSEKTKVVLVETKDAEVTWDYLYCKLKSDENRYGRLDYLLFGIRPLFHFFGKSTPNTGGIICSEMIYNDLLDNGSTLHFKEVPSPADLEKEFLA
jgi:hypothetical protein